MKIEKVITKLEDVKLPLDCIELNQGEMLVIKGGGQHGAPGPDGGGAGCGCGCPSGQGCGCGCGG